MREAFKIVAYKLQKRFHPKKIMEIGSNDGVFLKNFPKHKVVAVEPCKNLAKITKINLKLILIFGIKTFKINIKKKLKIDLIFSANTISHIPNLKETFEAIFPHY